MAGVTFFFFPLINLSFVHPKVALINNELVIQDKQKSI
jgi:hypothetical protein